MNIRAKRKNKASAVILSVLLILMSAALSVFASDGEDDTSPVNDLSPSVVLPSDGAVSGNTDVLTGSRGLLSPAIAIIANGEGFTKSGICGSELHFDKEDFLLSAGVSSIDSITVTSLPPRSAGTLMLGSLEIMNNQTVSAENLAAMRFVSSVSGVVDSSFTYRIDGAAGYELTCFLKTTERQNYAPTFLGIDDGEFSFNTYKNITLFASVPVCEPDGDKVQYRVTSYPERGVFFLTDSSNGSFTYTPEKNFVGKDSFSFTVTDEYGNISEEKTVRIAVSRSQNGTVFMDLIGKPEHNAAIYLSDREIMTGILSDGETVFNGDGKIGRAEFIMMVMKTVGNSGDIKEVNTVSVPDAGSVPSVYLPYVNAALEKGFIASSADLRPLDDITSSEAAEIYCRVFGEEYPADGGYLTKSQAALMLTGSKPLNK